MHCSREREREAQTAKQDERERERDRDRENMKQAQTKSFCVSCSCSRVDFSLLQVVVGVLVVKETFVWSVPLMPLFLRDRMAAVAAPVFAPLALVTASNGSFCKSQ